MLIKRKYVQRGNMQTWLHTAELHKAHMFLLLQYQLKLQRTKTFKVDLKNH